MEACCSKTFTDVQLTHDMGTNTNPTISKLLAFEHGVDNSLDSPFLFRTLNGHYFPNYFEIWTREMTAHFSTLGQSIWDEVYPREVGRFVDAVTCFFNLLLFFLSVPWPML